MICLCYLHLPRNTHNFVLKLNNIMEKDRILERTEQMLVELSTKPVNDLNECTELDFVSTEAEEKRKERIELLNIENSRVGVLN